MFVPSPMAMPSYQYESLPSEMSLTMMGGPSAIRGVFVFHDNHLGVLREPQRGASLVVCFLTMSWVGVQPKPRWHFGRDRHPAVGRDLGYQLRKEIEQTVERATGPQRANFGSDHRLESAASK